MSLAVQSIPGEGLAPPPNQVNVSIPTAMERAVGQLAMRLRVPAMVLQKLMLDAIRYPIVHRDLTRHTQLEVCVEDGQTGQLLPIPPIMLSFLEEGIGECGAGYEVPITLDLEQYADFPERLARAQWVLRCRNHRLDVPLFTEVVSHQADGSLWLKDAFPLGELIQSVRETEQQLPSFNFFQHLDHTGKHSGVAISIIDDGEVPVSHFGSLYSLQRALIAQRHYIYESLRLGFAAVLVPQLCQKGLPMRYQVVHRFGSEPIGIENRTLSALQDQVIDQGTTDIWLSDQTPSADLYGGCQGLVYHWRHLELQVQRDGCLPIHQRFIEVLQEDRADSRIQIRLATPLLGRDELMHEDDLL